MLLGWMYAGYRTQRTLWGTGVRVLGLTRSTVTEEDAAYILPEGRGQESLWGRLPLCTEGTSSLDPMPSVVKGAILES